MTTRAENAAPERRAWPLAVLALLACLVAFTGNGDRRPLVTHEIYVARTSTEMLRRDEWIVPWFNDQVRLNKPPLAYWLTMGAHLATGGVPEEPVPADRARFQAAAAGVLLVLLTARLGRRAAGNDARVGLLAGGVLATTLGLFTYAGSARPEMLYALFCTLMLYGFVEVQLGFDDERARVRAGWLAWTGAALAMLSKGPFLIVFMLVGIALAVRGHRPLLRFLQPLKGLLLLGGATALYFGEVVRRVPWAVDLWRSDMFEGAGPGNSVWLEPLKLYYVIVGPTLLLPWLPLLPPAIVRAFRRRKDADAGPERLLLFSTVACVFFLGFDNGPHSYYLLPCLSGLCVLMAAWGVDWFDRSSDGRRVRTWTRVGLAVVVAGVTYLVGSALSRPEWAPVADGPPLVSLALAGGAVGAAVAGWRGAGPRPVAALVIGLALLLCGFKLDPRVWSSWRFTEAAFAGEIQRAIDPERPVLMTGGAWETVLQYADRPVLLVRRAGLVEGLAEHPGAVILARERDGELPDVVTGEVLVRERWREDPSVLVDPSAGR